MSKEDKKPKREPKKTYTISRNVNVGVNKDGSPRNEYKKGDKVKLTKAQAVSYKQNKIIE